LESLELCGGVVTDNGCATLATLENLVTLNLSQNERITNRGAAALAALSKLKALNLSNTQVNSGALVHFSDLKNLQSLALYGCRGMEDINGLENGLPNLKCVRLNNGSYDDGVISTGHEDTDDEESDSEEMIFNSIRQRRLATVAFQHETDSENDSDNEMQDAHSVFESDDDNGEEENDSVSSFSEHDV
jgi:hypothetical protein